jgi:hypothetical protein
MPLRQGFGQEPQKKYSNQKPAIFDFARIRHAGSGIRENSERPPYAQQ